MHSKMLSEKTEMAAILLQTQWVNVLRPCCTAGLYLVIKNGLYEVFQSAYRQLHSTETALLRVQNDILQAVDSRDGAILVLLDLSAAFETIDHEKLIRTLDEYCGIKGDRSSQMVFIISERPCSICTNRIYFLSRTKSVVWCSSRLSPGASAFHNLHNPSW